MIKRIKADGTPTPITQKELPARLIEPYEDRGLLAKLDLNPDEWRALVRSTYYQELLEAHAGGDIAIGLLDNRTIVRDIAQEEYKKNKEKDNDSNN